jgi:hypothetical protein
MKNLLLLCIIISIPAMGQEVVITEQSSNRELNEKAEKFFFENLIGNKQNNNFKSVLIGDRLYNLKDSVLLQKYSEYAYFKRPSGHFLKSFTTFLMNDLFKTNDANVLKNIHYSLPFSSSELYDFYVIKEGLKIDNYTLQIATPFNESLYKQEFRKMYFHTSGVIEKVEELVESTHKPDSLLLNKLTTFTYVKGLLNEKVIAHYNIHTGQLTQKDIFKFDKQGKLIEVIKETLTYNNPTPKISIRNTIFTYNKGNLTEIKSMLKDKNLILYGYTIHYDKDKIEVMPLVSKFDSETFSYTLKN